MERPVKILHAADLHLGRLAGLGPKTADHHRYIDQAFARVVQLAAEQADVLLLVGDLLDRKAPFGGFAERAVTLIRQGLEAAPDLRVVIIAGNHDPAPLYQRPEWRDLPERAFIVTAPRLLGPDELGCDLHLLALPWLDGETLTWKDWPGGPAIAAAHACFPPPPQPRAGDCLLTPEEVERWPLGYLALGHYHNPSEHRAGAVPVVYSGAPEVMDLGHTGVGHVCLVTVSGEGPATWETIDTGQLLGLGSHTLRWRQLAPPRLESLRLWLEDKADERALLRLRVQGLADEPLQQRLKELEDELSGAFFYLDLRDETQLALDLETLATAAPVGVAATLVRIARERVEQAEQAAAHHREAGREEAAAEAEAEAQRVREAVAVVWHRLQPEEEEQ